MTTAAAYRVSTITATACVGRGVSVDLDRFFAGLSPDPPPSADAPDAGMYATYAEHCSKRAPEPRCKGVQRRHPRRRAAVRCFSNQVTVVVTWVPPTDAPPFVVNVKCFQNGNVQMTGLREISQGPRVVGRIAELMLGADAVADPSCVAPCDYRVRLINSDFRLGCAVRRDVLHRVVRAQYGVRASFEPCIYPGVKIQYFWSPGPLADGRCRCAVPCNGKGADETTGFCKKVTVSVFQSGCVIVTGAQSYEQVDAARAFITRVLEEHTADVCKGPHSGG